MTNEMRWNWFQPDEMFSWIMVFADVCILSSTLEAPDLGFSKTMSEGCGAFPDFIAFSAADTILCVISRGGHSIAWASSNIAASQENLMLSIKSLAEVFPRSKFVHIRVSTRNMIFLYTLISNDVFVITFQSARNTENYIFVIIYV